MPKRGQGITARPPPYLKREIRGMLFNLNMEIRGGVFNLNREIRGGGAI